MSLFHQIAENIDANDAWYDGDSILCKTKEIFDSFENVLSCLNVDFVSGYYDINEDIRDGVNDEYTGCWYITEE